MPNVVHTPAPELHPALPGFHWRRVPAWPALPAEARVVLAPVSGPTGLEALQEAARRHPDVTLIAWLESGGADAVLAAVRAGARDVVGTPAEASAALQRAFARLAPATDAVDARAGRTIAVFALKGGVGKSTLALNLAVALRKASRAPVTAVDLSMPCGNLDMYLDLQGPRGVADLLAVGPELEERLVDQTRLAHPSGVTLLAGTPPHAASSPGGLDSRPLFETLARSRGLAVVDVGAFLDEAQLGALEAADLILVPVTPLISSLAAMPAIYQHLEALGVSPERIVPVLNHVHPAGEPLPPALEQQLLRGRARHVLPHGGTAVARSLDDGQPFVLTAPRSPLGKAFTALAEAVLDRVALPAAGPAAPRFDLRWLTRGRRAKEAAHVLA